MNKLADIIQTAKSNLPSGYRSVLEKTDINGSIKDIADANDLDEQTAARLHREVSYLLLRVHDTVTFMERLEEKMGLSESVVTEITKQVTQQIINPMKEQKDQSMPVPPPPGSQQGEPPTPNYGGGSDPYREPTD